MAGASRERTGSAARATTLRASRCEREGPIGAGAGASERGGAAVARVEWRGSDAPVGGDSGDGARGRERGWGVREGEMPSDEPFPVARRPVGARGSVRAIAIIDFPFFPTAGNARPAAGGGKTDCPVNGGPSPAPLCPPPAPPPLARDKSAAKNRRGKWRRRHCAPHRRARHLGRPGPRRIDGQAGPFDPPRPPGTFVIETTPIAGLIGNPLVPGRGQRFSGNVSFTLYACTIIRWRQGG